MLPVQLKILDDRVSTEFKKPEYATEMSAGIDLVACLDQELVIKPSDKAVLIPTGISVYIGDPNYAAIILPRSGKGHKEGLILGNSVGLIDADYQGQLFVSAWNRNEALTHVVEPEVGEKGFDGNSFRDEIIDNEEGDIVIKPGERFAQLVFVPIARANFEIVDEFHEVSGRAEGGFGHSGV